jgi:hypothetical protein
MKPVTALKTYIDIFVSSRNFLTLVGKSLYVTVLLPALLNGQTLLVFLRSAVVLPPVGVVAYYSVIFVVVLVFLKCFDVFA